MNILHVDMKKSYENIITSHANTFLVAIYMYGSRQPAIAMSPYASNIFDRDVKQFTMLCSFRTF